MSNCTLFQKHIFWPNSEHNANSYLYGLIELVRSLKTNNPSRHDFWPLMYMLYLLK